MNSVNTSPDLDRELEELYSAIGSRPSFSYNPSTDPLYRHYADSYIQSGRMAMRDSMGQAAHLTGGYGSTYSQSVGQQQYNEYLRSLSDVLPELYSIARSSWQAEGDRMQNEYNMLYQRREDEYQRAQDEAAAQIAQQEREYERMQNAYKNLASAITSSGYNPSDDELSAAGMSRELANALLQQYLLEHPVPTSGGGGGGGGGSSKSTAREMVTTSTGSKNTKRQNTSSGASAAR